MFWRVVTVVITVVRKQPSTQSTIFKFGMVLLNICGSAADPYALGGPPQALGGPPRGLPGGEPTPSGAPQQAPDASQEAYVTGMASCSTDRLIAIIAHHA